MVTLEYTMPKPSEIRTCYVVETQPDGNRLELFEASVDLKYLNPMHMGSHVMYLLGL